MTSSLLAASMLALVGACVSPYAVRLAAIRASKQPLPYDQDAEDALLAYLRAHPESALSHSELPALFVNPEARAEAGALAAAARDARSDSDSDELHEVDDPAFMKLIEPLEELAFDREHYPGACGVTLSEVPPFVSRSASRMSALRHAVVALACASTGALAGYTAPSTWAALSVLILGVAGWVIALVDHDTLFLDIKTWWAASAIAAVFAAAHVLHDGDASLIGWSLLAGAVWWGLFEGINALYKLWRGIDGIGGGDGQIAFSAVFVSVSLTGSLGVALWSVMAGMVMSLLASIPLMVLKRRGRRDAFALGPFLASGWQLTLLLHAAGFII